MEILSQHSCLTRWKSHAISLLHWRKK